MEGVGEEELNHNGRGEERSSEILNRGGLKVKRKD